MWAQKQELAIKCTLRPSLNMPRLLSRDLKTAPQAVHIHKSRIYDDRKAL